MYLVFYLNTSFSVFDPTLEHGEYKYIYWYIYIYVYAYLPVYIHMYLPIFV